MRFVQRTQFSYNIMNNCSSCWTETAPLER